MLSYICRVTRLWPCHQHHLTVHIHGTRVKCDGTTVDIDMCTFLGLAEALLQAEVRAWNAVAHIGRQYQALIARCAYNCFG
jgi:hypothetical protein